MRNKIDYGIDLGTTNSAIVRMENGTPTIKKSDTLKDTIPSCVHFNKKQDILVGDPAFNVMKNDNSRALKTFEKGKANTFIEFKRTMGTSEKYECFNMSKSFTSDEISAEVLKTLKSFIKDENIASVVITVPAKFLNPQNEATMNAAKLAGFKHIQLLQEPVAAATAYGLGASSKDGYWLVFDFGGGTFDAALVKSEDGILSVKDTDGDNWLGGKNLDEAIVDQIIIPNLQQNFAIDSLLNDINKKEILRNAVKFFAEECKIQLSFKDTHNILTNLGDLPFQDDNGDEPEIDVNVTQKDMENVLAPIFQKAIDITKELLKRNNLKGADLGALILVGGPTYSPILRRMLNEQITENIDFSVDPMTVVAKGAALFASTVSVSEEVKDASRDKTKLQLDLKYEAASVDFEEMINIKILPGKTDGTLPEKVFVDVVRFDSGWSSGKIQITEKPILIPVLLLDGRSNAFNINAYDDFGNKLDCQPNQFSILQGIGGLDALQVLPYNIGIGKWFSEFERDGFMPAKGLEKNKRVPAIGVINDLRTQNEIRPGMAGDIICIPIYQGDFNAEGSTPSLNNLINDVIISGESLPKLLPQDSPVNITIKVDQSQIMKFSAEFPTIDHTEELEIDIKQSKPIEIDELAKEINLAKKQAQKLGRTDIIEKLEKLEEDFKNKKGSGSGLLEIQENLRKELFKLDGASKLAEWPNVEKKLKKSFFDLENLISKIKSEANNGDLDISKTELLINEFRQKIEHIIAEKNVKDAKELEGEIDGLNFNLRNLATGNAMDVQVLQKINNSFDNFNWRDPQKARQLVKQGLEMVAGGDTNIREILVSIVKLLPDDEKPSTKTLK